MIADEQRIALGWRTVVEVLELAEAGSVVLDPYSLLIGREVKLGRHNVFYPNVVIECDTESRISLGDTNTFLPGAWLSATNQGEIQLGHRNRIGEGGARITVDRPGAAIRIGHRTRVVGGAAISGPAVLGDGSQVIGQVAVQAIDLAAGSDWTYADPDGRGGVLKGFGRGRNLTVGRGEVLNGQGDFANAPLERQRTYHPDSPHLPRK